MVWKAFPWTKGIWIYLSLFLYDFHKIAFCLPLDRVLLSVIMLNGWKIAWMWKNRFVYSVRCSFIDIYCDTMNGLFIARKTFFLNAIPLKRLLILVYCNHNRYIVYRLYLLCLCKIMTSILMTVRRSLWDIIIRIDRH